MPADEIQDSVAPFYSFKVSELQIEYPHIKWMDYFNAIIPTDMKITPDDVVFVQGGYMDRLAEVWQKTSKRTITNYFVWR